MVSRSYIHFIDNTSPVVLRQTHRLYNRLYNMHGVPYGDERRELERAYRMNPLPLPNDEQVATILSMLQGLGYINHIEQSFGPGSGIKFINDFGNLIANNWVGVTQQFGAKDSVQALIEKLQTLVTEWAPRCTGSEDFPHKPIPMIFLSPLHPALVNVKKPKFKCQFKDADGESCNEEKSLDLVIPALQNKKPFPAPLPSPFGELVTLWSQNKGGLQYVGLPPTPPNVPTVAKVQVETAEPEDSDSEFPGTDSNQGTDIPLEWDDEEDGPPPEEGEEGSEDDVLASKTPLLDEINLPDPPLKNQYRTGSIFGRQSEDVYIVSQLPLGKWDIDHGHFIVNSATGEKEADPRGEDFASRFEWQDLALDRWVNADNGWRKFPGEEYRGIIEACTGSGKTKFAIKAIDRLLKDKKDENISITIMVPPSEELQGQWFCELQFHGMSGVRAFKADEIAMFGGFLGDRTGERKLINIYIVNTGTGKKPTEDDDDDDVSADIAASADDASTLLQYHIKQDKAKGKKHFLVADEVHAYSPKAPKFSRIFDEKPDYSLLITGTMIKGSYQQATCPSCKRAAYFAAAGRLPKNHPIFEIVAQKGEGRTYTCKKCKQHASIVEETFLDFFVRKAGQPLAFYSYPEALWKKNIANFRIWFVETPLDVTEKSYKHGLEGDIDLNDNEKQELAKFAHILSKRRVHELVRLVEFCIGKGLKIITFNNRVAPLKVIHRYLLEKASHTTAKEFLGVYTTRMSGYYGEQGPITGRFPIEENILQQLSLKSLPDEAKSDITNTWIEMPVPHLYAKLRKPAKKGDTKLYFTLISNHKGSPAKVPAGVFPLKGQVILPTDEKKVEELFALRAKLTVLKETTKGGKGKKAPPEIKELQSKVEALAKDIEREAPEYECTEDPNEFVIDLTKIKNGYPVPYNLKFDYAAGSEIRLMQLPLIRDLRLAYMEEFRVPTHLGGTVQVLLSGRALVQGIDVPDADVGVAISPVARHNPIPNLQSLGRVLRVKKVKDPNDPTGQKQIVKTKDYILFYAPGTNDQKVINSFARYLKLPVKGNPEGKWVCTVERVSYTEFFTKFSKYHGQLLLDTYTSGELVTDALPTDEVHADGFLEDDAIDFVESGISFFDRVNLFVDPSDPNAPIEHFNISGVPQTHRLPLGNIKLPEYDFFQMWNASPNRSYSIEKDFPVDRKVLDRLIYQMLPKLTVEAYQFINPDGWREVIKLIEEYHKLLEALEQRRLSGQIVKDINKAPYGDLEYGFFEVEEGTKNKTYYKWNEEDYYNNKKDEIHGKIGDVTRSFKMTTENLIAQLRLAEIHNPKVIKRVLNDPKFSKDMEKKYFCKIRSARQSGDPTQMQEIIGLFNQEQKSLGKQRKPELYRRDGGQYIFVTIVDGCEIKAARGRPQKPALSINDAIDKAELAIQRSQEIGEIIECYIKDESTGAIYNLQGDMLVPGKADLAGKYVVSCGVSHRVFDSLPKAKQYAAQAYAAISQLQPKCLVEIKNADGDVIGTVPGSMEPVKLSKKPYTLWYDKEFTDPVLGVNSDGKKIQYGLKTKAEADKAAKQIGKKKGKTIYVKEERGVQESSAPYTFWQDSDFTVKFVRDGKHVGTSDLIQALKFIGKVKQRLEQTVFVKGLPTRYSLWKDPHMNTPFLTKDKVLTINTKEHLLKVANKLKEHKVKAWAYDHETGDLIQIPGV